MKNLVRLLAPMVLLGSAMSSLADEPFYLRGGETILFFGDSITQNGGYVEYVEAFLRTRFPDREFKVINHGISSETISGTSELDHDPPRPDAHNRFARDVAAWKPDVLVACFGMNDGNYHPFENERYQAYQAGVRRLIERARDEAGATLVLLTPPPYDPYRRTASDPVAKAFGYKFAAIDYDDTLDRYSRWLVTLRDEGFTVADLHTAMNEHLARRRMTRVSFSLAPDAVHPDPTGHWLMAQTLLLAWHAPAECAVAEIDAAGPFAVGSEITNLAHTGDGVRFTWTTPLPMPLDPRWDAASLALEQVPERLNRHGLIVTNLTAKRYDVRMGDTLVGQFGPDELAAGVDLTVLPDPPTNRRSQEVLQLVHERSQLIYAAWRKNVAAADKTPALAAELEEADRLAAELDARLRELCRPVALDVALVEVEDN
jgi:lysophospholipase L1-like esterase